MGRLRAGPAPSEEPRTSTGPAAAGAAASAAAAGPQGQQGDGGQQQQRAAAAGVPALALPAQEGGGNDGDAFDEMEESPREGWRALWVRQRDKKKGSRQYRLIAAASMIQSKWLLRRHLLRKREAEEAAAAAAAAAAAEQAALAECGEATGSGSDGAVEWELLAAEKTIKAVSCREPEAGGLASDLMGNLTDSGAEPEDSGAESGGANEGRARQQKVVPPLELRAAAAAAAAAAAGEAAFGSRSSRFSARTSARAGVAAAAAAVATPAGGEAVVHVEQLEWGAEGKGVVGK
jgi:hypothetical protein